MKLFGKKTLALILALSMVMSVCVFATEGEGGTTPGEGGGEPQTPPATVAVTGVTLDATSKEVVAGESFELAATVAPEDATDKTVIWTSSNEAVATSSLTTLPMPSPRVICMWTATS